MMSNTRKGFTLFEMIIVVAIIGIVIPALFTIIFGIIKQQSKIYALRETKRQGDFALTAIENTIRNRAASIHSDTPTTANIVCDDLGENGVTAAYFSDRDGEWLRFFTNGEKIASASAANIQGLDLTGDAVLITNFSLVCAGTGVFSSPVVSIQFTVSYNTQSTRPEDVASLTYRTKIKLRNL